MLKQLLQLLLNTRTTPSEAAHNAAPGRIDIGISGQEYICPADGFVTASANAKNVGGFDMQLFRNGLSVQGGPQEVSVPAWTQAAMIPVAKGDTVNISLYNQNSWQWRFISSIGMGGGKFVELLYGGSVCLRALSNYLQRGFCKINIQTSLINVDRALQLKINQLPEGDNKISLPPLAVGQCFRLAEPMKLATIGSDWKTPQERLATYQTRLLLGSGLQFQSKKATPSSLILVLTQALEILSSFVTNRLNNFASGGAAC
ncbi:hypothetical protein HMPREF9439_01058 [Parasutterella excrementihominis YIT 11859]|uniref:Uncharacterized protein n=2 Tax=Parasutterella excrementihominis TaxID=487175 RepID=F3QJF7_9BURK|nr:hypothetical protein [Parasutterella excrementihominis]EGG55805.1 hypothetical protein HMPREF9439_01058 [Parasutterella excrementihominis YIT 11859]